MRKWILLALLLICSTGFAIRRHNDNSTGLSVYFDLLYSIGEMRSAGGYSKAYLGGEAKMFFGIGKDFGSSFLVGGWARIQNYDDIPGLANFARGISTEYFGELGYQYRNEKVRFQMLGGFGKINLLQIVGSAADFSGNFGLTTDFVLDWFALRGPAHEISFGVTAGGFYGTGALSATVANYGVHYGTRVDFDFTDAGFPAVLTLAPEGHHYWTNSGLQSDFHVRLGIRLIGIFTSPMRQGSKRYLVTGE